LSCRMRRKVWDNNTCIWFDMDLNKTRKLSEIGRLLCWRPVERLGDESRWIVEQWSWIPENDQKCVQEREGERERGVIFFFQDSTGGHWGAANSVRGHRRASVHHTVTRRRHAGNTFSFFYSFFSFIVWPLWQFPYFYFFFFKKKILTS
jgi:hypothetical protein